MFCSSFSSLFGICNRDWIFQVVPLGLGLGIQSSALYQRCLFSSSAATVNSENQTSKSSVDAKSGNGKHSGGSHESSDAGKSVRGGVIYFVHTMLTIYLLELIYD